MTRIVVGVLRGGASEQYAHSLKSGAAAIAALPDDHYDVRDIFIDKDGYWHWRGTPSTPERILSHIDVAINALHGDSGENGLVQRILERAGVAYTGARPLAAARALHKEQTRIALHEAGIGIPQGETFALGNDMTTADMAMKVFQKFSPPYIVKPMQGSGSIGVQYVPTIGDLPDAIGDILDEDGSAIVEEYIRGHEATINVVEGFRGEELYAFPPVHVIVPEGKKIVDAESRKQGLVRQLVPASFSHQEKDALIDAARRAHRALDMTHFSHADMILTPRGPVVFEVNAHPAFHEDGSLHRSLNAVGSSLREFLEHAITLARRAE